MKKLLIGLFAGVLMFPGAAFAQVSQTELDSQLDTLRSQLIALLMEQLEELLARVETLEEENDSLSADSSDDSEEVVEEEQDDTFSISATASASSSLVTFQLTPEEIDEVLVYMVTDEGHVQSYSARKIKDGVVAVPGVDAGVYEYTLTGLKYGPSKQYLGSAVPFDGEKAYATGTVTVR